MRKERAERKEKKSLDKCTKQKTVKDEMKKEKQPPPKPAEKKRNKKKRMQHRQVANDGNFNTYIVLLNPNTLVVPNTPCYNTGI